jgi:hypothetical protein
MTAEHSKSIDKLNPEPYDTPYFIAVSFLNHADRLAMDIHKHPSRTTLICMGRRQDISLDGVLSLAEQQQTNRWPESGPESPRLTPKTVKTCSRWGEVRLSIPKKIL